MRSGAGSKALNTRGAGRPAASPPSGPRSARARSAKAGSSAGLVVLGGLLLLAVTPARAQVATGTYVGNGTAGRTVFAGFQPNVVIVRVDYTEATFPPECGGTGLSGNDCSAAVIRTSTMPGATSRQMRGTVAPIANMITSLDSTGFTVGNDERVNGRSGLCGGADCTYYWVAIKGGPNVKIGTYAGNGTCGLANTQSITGVGFQPEYVVSIPRDTNWVLFRSNQNVSSYQFNAGSPYVGISSLDADGFTVSAVDGGGHCLNGTGTTYDYLAFNEAAGQIKVSSYSGTGATQSVAGVGFQPRYVITRALSPATDDPLQRSDAMPGNVSLNFRNASVTNGITALQADGFQVGTNNQANASGTAYAYLALGGGSGCCALSTAEGAGTITVTAPASFETVFRQAAGASLDSFFDLAEDPSRTYDLAGLPASEFHGLFHSSIVSGGLLYVTGENSNGPQLDLLEATPTRVRVRSSTFFQRRPSSGSSAILPGLKAIVDYSVYGSGRLGVHWNRRVTTDVPYTDHPLEMAVHYEALPDPRGSLLGYSQSGTTFPAPATDTFALGRFDASGARTDFLGVIYQAWPAADRLDFSGSPSPFFFSWRDVTTTTLTAAANPSESWNFLAYFKPTDLVDNTDPAVTSRAADYQSPSVITLLKGQRWLDGTQNTGASDDYNEAEGAYVLGMDPAPGQGLQFRIGGTAANPRYEPFFKIRKWRSFVDNPTVTLNGSPLTRDLDFKSDLKPLSRAHWASTLDWHCTMQSTTACDSGSLDVGVGTAGSTTGTAAATGRYGNGLLFTADTDKVVASSSDFSPSIGAIDFWYQPRYDSSDGLRYLLWYAQGGAGPFNCFAFEKTTGNTLLFWVRVGAADSACTSGGFSTYATSVSVASGAFAWRAYDWVHLKTSWNSAGGTRKLRIVVNGVEAAISGTFVAPGGSSTPSFGGCAASCPVNSPGNPNGILDEVHIYGGLELGSYDTNTPIAHAGLTSDSGEYLADPAKNWSLGLTPVDASRQGSYLYFGSDSPFLGLNMALQTPGVWSTTPGSLVWDYWDGTKWTSLQSGFNFTDTTNELTQSGTLYWDDPFGWSPYSVNGGPDLYYVRVHLAAGLTYASLPVERLIETDILLFQYCGDITAAAQEFNFSNPATTAVELMSFDATGADSAVDLSWQTGSELYNLGFNLYRGLSEEGPWTRITSSLIPGLGSSPLGATYTWRDAGLVNGTRYYYRLEDVDTHSVSTFHGPVSAVPQAAVAGESGGTGGTGGSGESGGSSAAGTGTGSTWTGGTGSGVVEVSGSGAVGGLPWCSWVASGEASGSSSEAGSSSTSSSSSAYPCVESYGDPGAVSVRVLSRTLRSAELELQTGGFYAIHDSSGGVRLSIPGFEDPADPHTPALPWKRAVVEAPVGRGARLGGVSAEEETRFGGLRLEATGYPEMEVRSDGTVLPSRRGAELRASGAVLSVARLLGESFQGETKRVSLELDPLSWDASSGEVVLTKRLRVRVDFVGVNSGETGSGTRGRRSPRSRPGGGETLAFLYTSHKGLYGVSFESLFPGRSRGLSVGSLGLHRQGEEVRFHVEPESGVFGPGSVLYFYADREASSTAYEGEVSWELVRETGGEGMETVEASPFGDELTTASLEDVGFEENRIYQSGLLEAEDLWQWEAVIGGSTKLEGVDLEGVDLGSPEAGHLELELQGSSDAAGVVDHHVRAYVNGVLVGEGSFDGKRPYRLEGEIPPGVLREGMNDVSVENVGDTGVYSLVFLDRFSVEYPQTSQMRLGRFEGEWSAGGTAQIGGVFGGAVLPTGAPPSPSGTTEGRTGVVLGPTSRGRATTEDRGLTRAPSSSRGVPGQRGLVRTLSGVVALDVTDPARPLWLYGLEPGSSTVRLRVESGRRYALVSPEGVLSPRVAMPLRSSLKSERNQADYVLIAPAAFLGAAEPLLERRRSQGLVTKAVSQEEIASVFGYGESSGEAIRAFLTYAYQHWARPSVRYVVLLGDASQDPRDFTGTAAPAPLPALFVKTSYLVTASDPALVAVNGDDLLPDLAIGRLPAQTVEEAGALVQKVLSWEDTGQGLGGEAVLVADNPDAGGNFEWDVADIEANVLGGRSTRTILLSREGAQTRGKILEAFDTGASLMSYVGHGGAAVWASENVLNTWDAESLLAQSNQPVMVTLDCLNGYFVAPNFDSLAEGFLKAEGRGTIAAFSPSGLSLDEPAHLFHKALTKELVSEANERLGDAVLKAQEDYAETGAFPELLGIYQLLGDPGMKIR
jgi:hypothetical protein